MNIYSICMACEMEGDFGEDICYDYDYITHEKLFTKEEFNEICEKCLSECESKWIYELKDMLIKEYGFKKLDVVCGFDFNEEM